jgi:hypothetical protein
MTIYPKNVDHDLPTANHTQFLQELLPDIQLMKDQDDL